MLMGKQFVGAPIIHRQRFVTTLIITATDKKMRMFGSNVQRSVALVLSIVHMAVGLAVLPQHHNKKFVMALIMIATEQ